jgi:transcriptional regulator ATRX
MKKLFSTSSSEDVASFGSKHWASVYLANTPQEAALMGLKFPGVNEVTFLVCVDNLLPYDISALLLLS